MEEDTIEVKLAADGSGIVTFEFDGTPVATLGDKNHNAKDSIPAGIAKENVRNLVIRYTPDGDMDEGEFEVRLPSGLESGGDTYIRAYQYYNEDRRSSAYRGSRFS